MASKALDTSLAHLEIIDGVLIVTYKHGISVNYEVAKQLIKMRLDFCENISYPVLIIDEGVLSMDKKARDLFSSKEGTVNIIASALVLSTVYSKVIGNFFIKVTRPHIPVKIFNDKILALEWLEQYKSRTSAEH
jgi:hypothetical protein